MGLCEMMRRLIKTAEINERNMLSRRVRLMNYFDYYCRILPGFLLAAVILQFSTIAASAADQTLCPVEQSSITGLSFEPDNMAFRVADGARYRVASIQFPGNNFFSATFRTQISDQIAKLINDYSNLAELSVGIISKKPDRYGRLKVNLYGGTGLRWFQQDLITSGLAMVNPQDGDEICIKQLFAAENTARTNRSGIWQSPQLIMPANEVDWQKRAQSFQMVEGIIVSVGKTNSRYYLNFGENWNEDFTVTVAKRKFKRFKRVYGDLQQLAGKKVRIRGWMIANRGPMIEIHHPGQIEIDIE